MVFVDYIYDMVVDTQFYKFYGGLSHVLYVPGIPHERYRSVTPLSAMYQGQQDDFPWTMRSITILRTDTI